jgi:hypothetical protein
MSKPMNVDEQIQALIDQAPQDGSTPILVEAIAPALKLLASQLKHSQYYVIQNLQEQWVMTTITNNSQPDITKTVVYAYSDLKTIASMTPYSLRDPQFLTLPIPVIHILFQMVAMKTIDSVIFFEIPGNANAGKEIARKDLDNLIQLHLQKLQANPTVPPNFA